MKSFPNSVLLLNIKLLRLQHDQLMPVMQQLETASDAVALTEIWLAKIDKDL